MSAWSASTLLTCFFRSYFITAAANSDGLQNIGFLYAMDPALTALYGEGERLKEARLRYAYRYNNHPFFTPMLLGVFLKLESAIAQNKLNPSILLGVKDATANALSAIGDSFFNGTLLATWALICSCLVLAGLPGVAVVFTLICFCSLHIFKLATFFMGFSKGMAVLIYMRKLDLINWGDHFKHCNAALVGCFLWLSMPGAPVLAFGGVALYLVLAGWIVGKLHVSRIFVALFLLACAVALHVSGLLGHIPAFFSSF